jgi:Mrp family chromosome partitioning ATPase
MREQAVPRLRQQAAPGLCANTNLDLGPPVMPPEGADMSAYEDKVRRIPRAPTGFSLLLGRLSGWLVGFRRLQAAESPAALSYRFLARQIATDLPCTNRGRTILLSSSVPAAASNEATLMFSHALAEELGVRVLLVDGTFSADGVGSALGHERAPGLMDFVYDGSHTPFDAILATSRLNISLLPAGQPRIGRPLPIEVERVAGLYEQLCRRFDYVLVQQGPIIADTRYLVCAAKADLVLVLVEGGVTPVDELDRCLDVFRGHQISGIRLVLCEPR